MLDLVYVILCVVYKIYSLDWTVASVITEISKIKDHQLDNFAITAGNLSCHYDDLQSIQCHQ